MTMTQGAPGQLLTLEEAAERFRVSASTLYRWCRVGRIPAFKIGRGWLIPASSFAPGPPRTHDAFREFLARTFNPRARLEGQHWLIASAHRHEHIELRTAIEEFVLSRRKTRLGRLLWEEGPDMQVSVQDKPGGFDIAIQAPAETAGSQRFADTLANALRQQAGRSPTTYVIAEGRTDTSGQDLEMVGQVHATLSRLARELRMVLLSNVLVAPEVPWSALIGVAGLYGGMICYADGRIYTSQGKIIDSALEGEPLPAGVSAPAIVRPPVAEPSPKTARLSGGGSLRHPSRN